MNLHPLSTLLEALDLFHGKSARPRCQGTDILRMGTLARSLGIERWKRSPSGTGRNVGLLRLGLRSHRLAIYAPSANAEVGDSGAIATAAAIALIHADDIVVVVDLDDRDGSNLVADPARLWVQPVPEVVVRKYGGDRLRAAVEHDSITVARARILPALQDDRSTDTPGEAA